MTVEIIEGKCYEAEFTISDRANAKVYKTKFHALEVREENDGITIITNHRPWKGGGTGSLGLDQIISAKEIPMGKEER